MASIIDNYKKSEFAKVGNSNKDKTPISADNTKLQKDEVALAKARGGKLNQKKYSDSVQY